MSNLSKIHIPVDKMFDICASVMTVVLSIFGLSQHFGSKNIKPERIYFTRDVSDFLGMDRLAVVHLIESGAIKACKGGDGNYLIVGQSLINYLADSLATATV